MNGCEVRAKSAIQLVRVIGRCLVQYDLPTQPFPVRDGGGQSTVLLADRDTDTLNMVQCDAVQYCTVQYNAVQCDIVQCSTVQYSMIQYDTNAKRTEPGLNRALTARLITVRNGLLASVPRLALR